MSSQQVIRSTRIDVNEYLRQQQQMAENNETIEWWTAFEELYNKKLWHQLTIKVFDFVKTQNYNNLLAFYENFIIDFETKMNGLTLIEIISYVIKQMTENEQKIQFITKMKDKVKNNNWATILCNIFIGQTMLHMNDMKAVKDMIEETNAMIEEELGITPVHARFYKLSSDYHQKVGNHCEYYRDALRYLGCCRTQDEDSDTQSQRAFTLALAAILGESIFNFGELLQHPIIETMKPQNKYMKDLLYAFNSGDLAKYESLKSKWSEQPDLASHEIQMRQKICLLSLMEMTFKSSNGVLSFEEIAKQTRLPLNDVELLVMKALSLGLVKGTIDEVEAKVHLSWVQPRVLDKKQIDSMRSKLEVWCKDINDIEKLLENRAHDIIN
jgi:26S proteasome regulatory subunit N9